MATSNTTTQLAPGNQRTASEVLQPPFCPGVAWPKALSAWMVGYVRRMIAVTGPHPTQWRGLVRADDAPEMRRLPASILLLFAPI